VFQIFRKIFVLEYFCTFICEIYEEHVQNYGSYNYMKFTYGKTRVRFLQALLR